MLSSFVIAFLPRRKHLLISWLQSPCTVILEPPKIVCQFPLFPCLFAMKWQDRMPWSYFSECWALSQLFHSPLSLLSRGSLVLHFCHKGSVICLSDVIDISPSNLDAKSVLHPAQCFSWCTLHRSWISRWQYTALMYSFPSLEPVHCSMSSSNCYFLTCIQVS